MSGKPQLSAADAYALQHRDANGLLMELEKAVEQHSTRTTKTWGMVGELAHVCDLLRQCTSLLGRPA
jgi:hypothetical protein